MKPKDTFYKNQAELWKKDIDKCLQRLEKEPDPEPWKWILTFQSKILEAWIETLKGKADN